jgi:hypothetical protein
MRRFILSLAGSLPFAFCLSMAFCPPPSFIFSFSAESFLKSSFW